MEIKECRERKRMEIREGSERMKEGSKGNGWKRGREEWKKEDRRKGNRRREK